MSKFAVDGLTVLAVVGTIVGLAACGSAESRDPQAPKAKQEVQIPGDGGGQADAEDAQQAVADYMSALADGDGEGACDLMTDAAIAGVVEDGKSRTPDEAYDVCVDTISSVTSIMDDSDIAKLRKPEFGKTTVDGDTAAVKVSIEDEPIQLERGEDGWYLANAPAA